MGAPGLGALFQDLVAAIGAVQGLLVAGIGQISAGYDWGDWSIFAGVSILAGIAFAAVNQALVAVFGGAGRWAAALQKYNMVLAKYPKDACSRAIVDFMR